MKYIENRVKPDKTKKLKKKKKCMELGFKEIKFQNAAIDI